MLPRRGACLLWLSLVVACASASPPSPPPVPARATPAAPRAIIDVAELTVRFEGMPIARLHADGRTESVGDNAPGPNATFSPGPTLHADGTIALTKAGFTARVDANGDIFVVSPPEARQPAQRFGRLVGDQLSMAGMTDRGVRLDGATLVMFQAAESTSVLGVVDPPRLGRTALIMTAAFFIDLAITAP